jgi:hypothetical protein
LTEQPKCANVNHYGARLAVKTEKLIKLIVSVLAGSLALLAAGVAPASAEFFGCKEPHTTVTYSPGYYPHRPVARNIRHFSAPRSRHAAYSMRRVDRRYRTDWWH